MFLAGLQTLQVTFPENIDPKGSIPEAGPGNWKDVSDVSTKTRSLDPILFTDQRTGRTFVSQLNSASGGPALIELNSLLAYTDDDGATWTPAQINPPDGSNDHQTVGAGPYPVSVPLGNDINKGDAVYYCGQSGNVLVATSAAFCSRSDDGGLNFGKSVPIYVGAAGVNGPACSQMIHGHVKVAPDGTVYVPNAQCGGKQGIAVSTDAGITWTVKTIPDSLPGNGGMDPSVGIASDNTVYFAYTGAVPGGDVIDAHIFVAVSKDRGEHWAKSFDVGSSWGINNAAFPSAVAGDPDRAAVVFLGTTTRGNHQDVDFKGTWYGWRDDVAAHLKWSAPDAGGSPIGLYKIYRGTYPDSEKYIGKTTGDDTDFVDRSVNPGVATYTYKVTAVNSVEGSPSNIVSLQVGPRPTNEGAC